MSAFALPRADWVLIVLGAGLTTLAYPPFHLLLPSFVCLVPAIMLIVRGDKDPFPLRRQLVQGFLFGAALYGLLLYWMAFALWRITPPMVPAYAASVLVLGAYTSGTFALVGWIGRTTRLSLLLVFPVLWTATDWIIGHQGDLSFPWLGLGTSLTGFPTLVQIADVIGARGVTLGLVAANTALAMAWLQRTKRIAVAWRLGVVALGIVAAAVYGIIRERQILVRPAGSVGVLQPNIPAHARDTWPPDSIVSIMLSLAEQAIAEAELGLVVLPEAAIPRPFSEFPEWELWVADQARSATTTFVVGGYDPVSGSDDDAVERNAAFVFDVSGSRQAAYHKRHLVPLIEQVPFLRRGGYNLGWSGRLGPSRVGTVYGSTVGRFGILICFESAFEHLARDYRLRGADFLLNLTNDVWFGRSSGPYQHEAHLVMRAIENRVGIVRAANSGVSGFLSPLGRRYRTTPLEVRTHITAQVLTSDVMSVYSRLGDWIGRGITVFAVALVVFAWWERREPNVGRLSPDSP